MPPDHPPANPSAHESANVLEAEGVSKAYGERLVLDEVSFAVPAAQRVALTGPSGSGKTTLLNCLGGIDRPDRGSVTLHGETINTLSQEKLAQVRRRRVGTIFQFFHLLPTLTAFENAEFPLQLLGIPPRVRAERVSTMLEKVNLTSRADALPSQLSGGEMQRVAIARALVHQPDLILADEPTGNLDSANGRRILDLLEKLADDTRTALVLVTHSEEAASICHRTIHLRDGRIV